MSVANLQRLRRRIEALPAKVRAEVRKAIGEGCDEIVAYQRHLAPKRTGRLAKSIGWTWGDAPEGALLATSGKSRVARDSVIGRDEDIKATIYAGDAEAYYARLVEFGTAPHTNAGKFAGTRNPGMAAQPYFFPGYRAGKKRVKSKVTRRARKALREVASGG